MDLRYNVMMPDVKIAQQTIEEQLVRATDRIEADVSHTEESMMILSSKALENGRSFMNHNAFPFSDDSRKCTPLVSDCCHAVPHGGVS